MQHGPHEQVSNWVSSPDFEIPGGVAAPVTPPSSPDPSWGFNILDQAEMFGALPDIEFVVEQVLPEGSIGLLAGRGGTMKSMMALDMAIAVTTGGKFLGEFECKPGYVLYLNYENPKNPFLWRVQLLTRGRGFAAAPVILGHFPRAYLHEEKFRDYLRAALSSPWAPRLIIIDTLRAAMPGVDENDSSVRAPIDEMRRVVEGTGTSVLLLHHAGKGNSLDDAIRGSSALRDAVDVAFVVAPTATEGTIRLKQSKARDNEPIKPVDVRLEKQPGAWRLLTVDPARDAVRDRQELNLAVLAYLETHPSPTSTEVAQGVQRRRKNVEAILAHLSSVGAIEKKKQGRSYRYALTEQ